MWPRESVSKSQRNAHDENCVVVATGARHDEPNLFGGAEDWLAEIFVAEVGDGLLVEVGVVGVEGVA